MLGNHDQSRLASRIGDEHARAAAMLLLTLRGTPTIYYGEEIGMRDVAIPKDQEIDPAGFVIEGMNRDPERTPIQWRPGNGAGFTTGDPWLPVAANADVRNVEKERGEPGSMLVLYRRLLHFRRAEPALATGDYERVWTSGDVLAFIRTDGRCRFLVALNFGAGRAPLAIEEAGEGSFALGTDVLREGEPVQGSVLLGPNEGVIVALSR